MEKERYPFPVLPIECPSGREEHEIRYLQYEEKLREERK